MNFGKIILICAALVISITSRADSFGKMIQSLGNYPLDNSGSRLEVYTTNNEVLFKANLANGSGISSDNELKNGWFIFPESAGQVWVFDGTDLSVVLATEKNLSISDSQENYRDCPKQVQDALPSKFRAKYFSQN
jgi:hypothetical protein